MKIKQDKGFAIFIAIAITGTLLLVSTALVTVAVKEAQIASAGRESQYAFYAADTGLECAFYWDVKQEDSYFATSTKRNIVCNGQPTNNLQGDTNPVTTFTFDLRPEVYCVKVVVTKNANNTTTIESSGYNTCDLTQGRRVERAVRASY